MSSHCHSQVTSFTIKFYLPNSVFDLYAALYWVLLLSVLRFSSETIVGIWKHIPPMRTQKPPGTERPPSSALCLVNLSFNSTHFRTYTYSGSKEASTLLSEKRRPGLPPHPQESVERLAGGACPQPGDVHPIWSARERELTIKREEISIFKNVKFQ